MAKVSLSDLANLQNEATAVATMAANNTAIENAMENTLSRDGTVPNSMNADLDMNNNQILNLPDATSAQEPLTYSQFVSYLTANNEDFISAATVGAVLTGRSNSSPTYLKGVANVKAFGAVGDGLQDDTAAIQAAMDSTDYACIYLPKGVWRVNGNGITGQSNKMFIGDGQDNTIIQLSEPLLPGKDFFFFFIKDHVIFKSLTLDGNAVQTPPDGGNFPGYRPCIYFLDGDHIWIEDVEFKGFDSAAFLANTAHTIVFKNNLVERATASTGVGYTNGVIGVSIGGSAIGSGADAYDFVIDGNTCINCSISTSGHDSVISNNMVRGCDFGAGIFTTGFPGDQDMVIAGNTIHDIGHSLDRDSTYPDGIQNWGTRAVISNNIVHNCWGPGISNGGKNCLITGNISYNNGQANVPGSFAGFYAYRQDADFNASGSHWIGNKAFDTQTPKTQSYGFIEHPNFANQISNITLIGNQFQDNAIGPLLLQSVLARGTMEMVGTQNISQGGLSGGSHVNVNPLSLLNTGTGAFALTIKPNTTMTANHDLTLVMGDNNRTLTMTGGDVSFGGQFVVSGTNSITLNVGGTTNLTIPAISGDTFTLNNATQTLTNKTLSVPTITTRFDVINIGTGAFALGTRVNTTMTGNRFITWATDADHTLSFGTAGTKTFPDGTYTIATRGTGLSQFPSASTSSADLRTLLSDETGTGAAVFATAPTMTGISTDTLTASGVITTPFLAGGSAANSSLTIRSTQGAGTSDAIVFQTGSQVEAGRITTGQQIQWGSNFAPASGVKVQISANSAAFAAPIAGTILHIGNADSTSTRLSIDAFANSASIHPAINFRHARGTSASKTGTTSGDIVGAVMGFGYNLTTTPQYHTNAGSGMLMIAEDTFNLTSAGQRVEFYATQSGQTTSAAVARFDRPNTATQTALLLYDVDNNAIERVTVGAADSGGAGFKVLRIPN